MIELKDKPFYLSDEDIHWVNQTLNGMTMEEKVGQLFCPLGFSSDERILEHLLCEIKVGGIMFRQGAKNDIRNGHSLIQSMAKIPLLLAANTECGGDGLFTEGTSFGNPMAVAATGNIDNAYKMGYTACMEGSAAGMNWSFAPVVDIDFNFHNPITNVRTFGSNPDDVLEYAKAYLKGADEAKVATAVKHFPGDGCDERDQHLLTSINSMTVAEWDETYGKIYRGMIEAGTKSIMVGHIAQPAYVEFMNPAASAKEKLLPASMSGDLITGLLRKQLKFNGLVVTDATPMVGYTAAMPRENALIESINAGVDMILFNRDLDEDYHYVLSGVQCGKITMHRMNEAVIRILGMKAALGLHIKKKEGVLVPSESALSVIGCQKHSDWAEEVAQKAITLVKDTQRLLPISPEKYRRIYLNVIQKDMNPENPVAQTWKRLFEEEGFEVTLRNRSTQISMENLAGINLTPEKKALIEELNSSIEFMKKRQDLYVYIANIENASNNTTARLNWNVLYGRGDDIPWFSAEIPTLFISTSNPYHLFDVPTMKTFINGYHTDEHYNKAIMDKLVGRGKFEGKNPVDPFCGNKYLRMELEAEEVG